MFDIKKYYQNENRKIEIDYDKSYKEIKNIICETKESIEKYDIFFNHTAEFIIKLMKLEDILDENYFKNKTFEELLEENNSLYKELLPQNYNKSYVNPKYCIDIFGDELGQIISYFYSKYREYIKYTFRHKKFKILEYNILFIESYNYIKSNSVEYSEFKNIVTKLDRNRKVEDFIHEINESYDKNFKFYNDIVENSNLNDLRYLFKYGEYITENEIKISNFLKNYSYENLVKISRTIVDAYIRSFKVDAKDILKKKTVTLPYLPIGQEIIVKELIQYLKENSLDTVIKGAYSVNETFPYPINKQYLYDHRFDEALYFDKDIIDNNLKNYEKALIESKEILDEFSGYIYLLKFGMNPFEPNVNSKRLEFKEEKAKEFGLYKSKKSNLFFKYCSYGETSFTVISFPTPEIGKNFEDIFDLVLKLNMLENEKYEVIQQKLIDKLDLGEYIHVKGKDGNKTDILIKMQKITNPDKETNFGNYLADKNIPLGEVYTSPNLSGTNGVIHTGEIYLQGLKYIDFMLKFKNGYIVDYNCSNFDDEFNNKKYIKDNLIAPHKTLPMGEFAIGTNTLAYVLCKKYNIMDKLPNLILEKMGPHFAIGDTCFSGEEDIPIYNSLDRKEMIARDNEKSILRKTDIDNAYTNTHIDISLPYDAIGFIKVVTRNGGKINIIENGKFVLNGTEELNRQLDEF